MPAAPARLAFEPPPSHCRPHEKPKQGRVDAANASRPRTPPDHPAPPFAGQDQVWLVKLKRTASINFGFRSGVSDSSFVNEHATSSVFTSTSEKVLVTATTFTAPVSAETTEVVSAQQSP